MLHNYSKYAVPRLLYVAYMAVRRSRNGSFSYFYLFLMRYLMYH